MADISWSIKIGGVASPTDFSDRCQGLQVVQRADFMRHRSGRAQITLQNYDGALTPDGGGTYSSTDWFEQGVFISAGTAQVFHGIVDDFIVNDNGVYSTVTVMASDWFSVFGRATQNYLVNPGQSVWYENVQAAIWEFTSDSSRQLPALGQAYGTTVYNPYTLTFDTDLATSTLDWGNDYTQIEAGRPLADILRPGYLAAVPSAMWATTIEADSGNAVYHMGLIGDQLTRSDSGARTYQFRETPASGQLPINLLTSGFNNDNMVNHIRATIQNTSGGSISGATINRANQTAIDKYGKRSLTNDAAGFKYVAFNRTMSDTLENLVARMSEITYVPERVTVRASSTPTAGVFNDLLDVTDGFWQVCDIEYTPTGAASTTTGSVIVSRTINATPRDTTIVLDLLPAANYQSFTLNSDILGVLNQNRLG
jgi:hypothetical protein